MRAMFILAACVLCFEASLAQGAILTGEFTLFVTDPGSMPLVSPFTGSFAFDDTANPTFSYFGSVGGDLYYLPIVSASLTGGDSNEGCCYVLDPTTAFPSIVYQRDGHPWSIGLFFRNQNATPERIVAIVSPDQCCWPDHPNYGLHWVQNILVPPGAWFGNRGGISSLVAPTLPAVPEPATLVLLLATMLFHARHVKPLLLKRSLV